MTYTGVLLAFILPPVAVLSLLMLLRWDKMFKRVSIYLLIHVLIAVIYTTPWDNYLVANAVWWYDPALVSGLVIGWVPIEEYSFFVLQTLLTGLWLFLIVDQIELVRVVHPGKKLRLYSVMILVVLWIGTVGLLLSGWQPVRYLSLILVWGLLPLQLQLVFGADILFANRKVILASILPPTLYLWLVDWIAIRSGTWTISPEQTTGVLLGLLPLEEMLFFLVTNLLLVFGLILMLSPDSKSRLVTWWNVLGRKGISNPSQSLNQKNML